MAGASWIWVYIKVHFCHKLFDEIPGVYGFGWATSSKVDHFRGSYCRYHESNKILIQEIKMVRKKDCE